MKVTSEGPITITKETIKTAWKQRAPNSRRIIRDLERRGLALIINPTAATWVFTYRPRGHDPNTGRRWPNRTVTLGNTTSLTPDDARREADRIKGQVAAGRDPVAEKKAKLAEEQRKHAATLGRLAEEYCRVLPARPKMRGAGQPSAAYVAIETAQVRLALQQMRSAHLPAADLDAPTIRKLLNTGDGAGNTRARFGALSRFLDWCQDEGHIRANPCSLISRARRPKPPNARSNYLTPTELARLWHAAADLDSPVWRDLIRFLICVPCRRGEAATLDWSHLNLTTAEWHQPGALTKNAEPHRLHLHSLTMEVLQSRRRALAEEAAGGNVDEVARLLAAGKPRSGLVFPAPRSGRRIDTFSDIKSDLDKGAEMTGWVWHDFRRSFASALGEAGIPEAVADAILNHRQAATRGGVLGVYQRSSRWPEQVKAMERWGRLLKAALDRIETAANVVPLRRAE